jgi:CDP-2,3-bis-(O-geranylgeranyl)-sn-glycerol synthase
MDTSVISVLVISVYLIYFMLPAYIANASALAFGGGTPLDFHRKFIDGRRILIGTGIGTLIGLLQGILGEIGLSYGILPDNVIQGILLGLFMGAGALIGDASGSFLKRRIGIERGRPIPLLDQLDFVVGALIFASIIVVIPWDLLLLLFVISIILHLLANIIAYLIGIKDVWY